MVIWDPEDYQSHSPAQQQWAGELIGKIRLSGDEHVIDLGCGDGRITAEIAARVPRGRVVGIDSSQEMIRYARSHFPAERHPNLSFTLVDFRDLPVPGEYDIAFSNAALHWIGDQVPVLTRLRENLARGGRVFFQMGGKGNAARFINRVLPEVIARIRWRPYLSGIAFPYHFFGETEYSGFLRAAGLVPVRVELIQKRMTYPSPDGLAGWIRTTWLPYTQRVPEALRDQLVQEIVTQYIRLFPPDCDGTISVPMVRLEVEAVKG